MLHFLKDVEPSFFDPAAHRRVLRAVARSAIADKRWRPALHCADRLCRLTREEDADALMLRSAALEGMDDIVSAEADIEKAAAIDPTQPSVARAMLMSGTPASRLRTARQILQNPRSDRQSQRIALDVLHQEDGAEVVSMLRASRTGVIGRILWYDAQRLSIQAVADEPFGLRTVEGDSTHPLTDNSWSAAEIDISCTLDRSAAESVINTLVFRSSGRVLRRFSCDSVLEQDARSRRTESPSDSDAPPDLTVIVPLFEAPRLAWLCLLALARETKTDARREVILVNDNPANPRIKALAEHAERTFGFKLICNEANLGFARSVNRAIRMTPKGDILLLNSDVILTTGSLGRLARAALASNDIGTLTPLADNGEEASFPSPFHPQRMLPFRELCALDRVAARENAGRVVDLVNGVGFCLYITRRALETAGAMPTIYARGYYEDVDFCLKVRAAGLRNVCATDVYVGHAGSSSFQSAKRGLVVRNRRVLRRQFPCYEDESDAFLLADPLRVARARIEAAYVPKTKVPVAYLVPPETSPHLLARYRQGSSGAALYISWSRSEPRKFEVRADRGAIPQSLIYGSTTSERDLIKYLEQRGVERLALLGPCADQTKLVECALEAQIAVEIKIDESLLRVSPPVVPDCADVRDDYPCTRCTSHFSEQASKAGSGGIRLGTTLRKATSVVATNSMAAAVGRRLGLSIEAVLPATVAARAAWRSRGENALGILGDALSVPTMRFLQTLSCYEPAWQDTTLVLLGSSLDDLRLMSSGTIHVTGPVDGGDLPRLIDWYAVTALIAADRWAGFGSLERSGADIPWAYFDWSGGTAARRSSDLAIDPRVCDHKASRLVADWWSQLAEARPSDDV